MPTVARDYSADGGKIQDWLVDRWRFKTKQKEADGDKRLVGRQRHKTNNQMRYQKWKEVTWLMTAQHKRSCNKRMEITRPTPEKKFTIEDELD